MNKLYIMVGLPGSGKSTIARLLARKYDYIVSTDDIRAKLSAAECNNELVFKIAHENIIRGLARGRNVIFDATNIAVKHRQAILQKTKEYKSVAIVVASTIEDCISRNAARERVVSEEIIRRMWKTFEAPSTKEGFEKVRIIKNSDFILKWEDLEDMEQDNPNHSLTVKQHCEATANYIADNYPNVSADLLNAATIHDLGKFYCKEFKNYKGEPTENAHYYGHENIGAYQSYFLLPEVNENVRDFIQYHMKLYNLGENKTKNLEQFLGREFFEELKILNDADRMSK